MCGQCIFLIKNKFVSLNLKHMKIKKLISIIIFFIMIVMMNVSCQKSDDFAAISDSDNGKEIDIPAK